MTCMTEGCLSEVSARGVCRTCYYRLQKRVKRGKASWGELIKGGKCKIARRYPGLTSTTRRQVAIEAHEFKQLRSEG